MSLKLPPDHFQGRTVSLQRAAREEVQHLSRSKATKGQLRAATSRLVKKYGAEAVASAVEREETNIMNEGEGDSPAEQRAYDIILDRLETIGGHRDVLFWLTGVSSGGARLAVEEAERLAAERAASSAARASRLSRSGGIKKGTMNGRTVWRVVGTNKYAFSPEKARKLAEKHR